MYGDRDEWDGENRSACSDRKQMTSRRHGMAPFCKMETPANTKMGPESTYPITAIAPPQETGFERRPRVFLGYSGAKHESRSRQAPT